MQYLLAHDLGTSGDKATLFTTDGALVRSTVASYPCHYGPGNRAEQDPEDWYAAVCQATRSLLELAAPEDVVGVSFSGHMMGSVLLDRHGALLRPAIIWADQRATEEAPQDYIFRLDVPVDGPHGMEHPQGAAELAENAPGFFGGKEGVLQHHAHVVSLDVFLQNQILLSLRRDFVDGGQIGAFTA